MQFSFSKGKQRFTTLWKRCQQPAIVSVCHPRIRRQNKHSDMRSEFPRKTLNGPTMTSTSYVSEKESGKLSIEYKQ